MSAITKKHLFCSLLFVLVLAGCSPENKKESGNPRITIWHWMTDREPALRELGKRYESAYGVKVNFELYAPSDSYSQKIRAAAQGFSLPDIFGVLVEKRDFVSFIKAGHVLELTFYMEADNSAWKKSLHEKALAVDEFRLGNAYGIEPGIYGVPIDMMAIGMLYNKELFRSLGLDPASPPRTFAEFIEIGRKIKAANMQGLVSGWGELWLIDCLANNYAFNIMGEDKVLATIRGEVPYTDPGWVRVFSLFKEMQASGLLASGLVTMVNKNAEQLFANGKAVFAFNGSWCVNVYKGMNPGLDYGVMLPPQATDTYPMSIWGGAGSSFVVNARSKNKEEAVKFLRWLTGKEQQIYLSKATMNLPANKDSSGEIPPVLARFAEDMKFSTHPNTWGVSEYPMVIEAIDKGIQSIIIGEKTPEAVSAQVQKVKERETAKYNALKPR